MALSALSRVAITGAELSSPHLQSVLWRILFPVTIIKKLRRKVTVAVSCGGHFPLLTSLLPELVSRSFRCLIPLW